MAGTDAAYINRTIGQVYTDLEYLVDVGVITDADYEQITAKIPRRYRGAGGAVSNGATPDPSRNGAASANTGRPVPVAPLPQGGSSSPAPPAYHGVGMAEGLYDYEGTDSSDLPFRVGDQITILEYVNNDWWKGECHGHQGLFPSNYVRKVSDNGRQLEKVSWQEAQQYPTLPVTQYNSQQYQPVQYAPPPSDQQIAYAQTGAVQPQQQAPVTVVQDKKTGKLHSIGGKLGNAAIFGAGATIGSNIVNSIF